MHVDAAYAEKLLGVHLIPGVVDRCAVPAVGVGADLLDRVARIAVDPDPWRRPAVLARGAACGRRSPRSDHVSGAGPRDRVARPVRARAAPELVPRSGRATM